MEVGITIKEIQTAEKLQESKLEQVPEGSSQSNLQGAQKGISEGASVHSSGEQETKLPTTSTIQNIPENTVAEPREENLKVQQESNSTNSSQEKTSENIVEERKPENLNVQQESNSIASKQETSEALEKTLDVQKDNQLEPKGMASEEKVEPEKSLAVLSTSQTNEQKNRSESDQEATTSSNESAQNSGQGKEVKPLDDESKQLQKTEDSSKSSQKAVATIPSPSETAGKSSESSNVSPSTSTNENTKEGKFKFSKSGKVKKTQAKDDKKESQIKNQTAGSSLTSLSKYSKTKTEDSKANSGHNDASTKSDASSSATSSKEPIKDKSESEISPNESGAEKSIKSSNDMTEAESKPLPNEKDLTALQENKLQSISSKNKSSGQETAPEVSPEFTQNNSVPAKDLNAASTSTADLKTDQMQTPETSGTEQKTTESAATSSNSAKNNETAQPPEVQLQEPVVSKEFPGTSKSSFINDAPSSSSSVSDSSNVTEASSSTAQTAVVKEEVKDPDSKVAPEQSNQHSKTQEAIITDTSTSGSNNVSSPVSSVFPSKNTSELQTVNEERSTPQPADLDDSEYSDESRPSSVTPPSPVDALRSRFEGLAGGTTIRGQTRPQSPFRRMSLNSRKQVIALEKIRSTEKPWYHQKIVSEPVKSTIPKRTIKQQLEMERRVRQMVSDRKIRTYRKAEIVVQLMDLNFEEEEAIQAANECSTLEQAISYLQQECLLCAGHFPVSQIVSMTHCEHRACRECIRAYFTVQIRDRTILDLLCPFCNEPDIGDEDVAQDYFNHLDIMLKKLVDIEIHELFQRKLRDRVLMKDPNFRWCSQCSSGFIAMPNLKRLVCPDCNAVTCASCRRLWEREHQGISCEAFAAMKDATDPETQTAGLAKMLTEDGIDCPSCHFRYALAKGGCMHFRCIQCQHDFCSGCSRPFRMGQKCGVSEFCAKLGLHAHHPRNCLFYLRDKDPEDLQKLLEMNDIKYDTEPPDAMDLKSMCHVMEQKETADGMVDDYCGKEVQEGYAGLCRVHYVEYLGQLVNKHKVDPIQIFENDDLELVLRRANVRLPPRRYRENDEQYREKLVDLIQDELPLDKMDGS